MSATQIFLCNQFHRTKFFRRQPKSLFFLRNRFSRAQPKSAECTFFRRQPLSVFSRPTTFPAREIPTGGVTFFLCNRIIYLLEGPHLSTKSARAFFHRNSPANRFRLAEFFTRQHIFFCATELRNSKLCSSTKFGWLIYFQYISVQPIRGCVIILCRQHKFMFVVATQLLIFINVNSFMYNLHACELCLS